MKAISTVRPSIRLAVGACLLLLVAACGDEPVAPEVMEQELGGPAEPAFSALLTCRVDASAGTMSCDPKEGTFGPAGGPQGNLIVGSQHRFVRMRNDAPVVSGDVWSTNVWVQNLTLQPFGTLDGEAAEASGVRVFSVDEPTNGVEVVNPDGTDTFLGSSPAKYYGYSGSDLGDDGILRPGEESEPRPWEFDLNGASAFQFSVLVSTVVPDPGTIGVHITRVSAGAGHVCGDGADGKVYCWGGNFYGQLGDGTDTLRHTPVAVKAPGNVKLSNVSVGSSHSCAEGDDDRIYCWGDNAAGELGHATLDAVSPVPAPVESGGLTLVGAAPSYDFTCAEDATGGIHCWGSNEYGQFGNDSKLDSPEPVAVHAPAGVKLSGVTARRYFACAVAPNGVCCWGAKGDTLGDGAKTNSLTPVLVAGTRGS